MIFYYFFAIYFLYFLSTYYIIVKYDLKFNNSNCDDYLFLD